MKRMFPAPTQSQMREYNQLLQLFIEQIQVNTRIHRKYCSALVSMASNRISCSHLLLVSFVSVLEQ